MLNLLKFTSALLFASFVAGQGQQTILVPNSTNWWVAGSDNILTWNCGLPGNPSPFTVLIKNKDQNVLAAPLAIIAQQEDSQCSRVITQNQASQPAAKGYTILFANQINNTDVYVTSQEFEIKPLGSLYPSQVQSSSSSSATGSSPTPTGKSGSTPLKAGLGAITLAAFTIVALFT